MLFRSRSFSNVRLQRADRIEKLRRADLRRLRERKPELVRPHRDRGRLKFHTAPRRFVRLGDDEHDLVHPRDRFERRNREFRRAEKDDAQSGRMLARKSHQ